MRKNKKIFSGGFTLLELLVVMAILGILAAFISGSYTSSKQKARDAKRKNDVRQLQSSLEAYYNDQGLYPVSDGDGKIVGCGDPDLPSTCEWGVAFATNDVVYMAKLPIDPKNAVQNYYYNSSDGASYQIYAQLENENDGDYNIEYSTDGSCTYGTGSPNSTPGTGNWSCGSAAPGASPQASSTPTPSPGASSTPTLAPQASSTPTPAGTSSPTPTPTPLPSGFEENPTPTPTGIT